MSPRSISQKRQAWRDIRRAELGPSDRLVVVSKAAFARGTVDIAGRKTLFHNPAKGQLSLRGAELVRSVGSVVAQ